MFWPYVAEPCTLYCSGMGASHVFLRQCEHLGGRQRRVNCKQKMIFMNEFVLQMDSGTVNGVVRERERARSRKQLLKRPWLHLRAGVAPQLIMGGPVHKHT